MESYSSAVYWDNIIRNFTGTHLLQTWEWGQVKAQYGWKPIYVVWKRDGSFVALTEKDLTKWSSTHKLGEEQLVVNAAAMILQRTIPLRGFSQQIRVLYCPKGPLLDWTDNILWQRVLKDLSVIAKQYGAIFIKIDPDVRLGVGIPGTQGDISDPNGISLENTLVASGWHLSDEQIQFRNTCIIDLTASEDELLTHLKQKTRYNIRLAERKGVTIRIGTHSDIPLLYQMYAETSQRDKFIIRDEDYYRTVFQTFLSNPVQQNRSLPSVQLLIAEVAGEPVAALALFLFASKAWYLYGMSREAHREKMPNHLLQWEAIRLAKSLDCHTYDLWGAPDHFNETDPMWGVYRFKEGLGGTVVRHIGAWDNPTKPILYRLYTQTIPRILSLMRQRQKNQRMVG